MNKYNNLTEHLSNIKENRWRVSFSDLEAVLGFDLPASARNYPAWWSNGGHSQSESWQSINWKTGDLDLKNEFISFFKLSPELEVQRSVNLGSMSILDAKQGLSKTFDVPLENIEILIKG